VLCLLYSYIADSVSNETLHVAVLA